MKHTRSLGCIVFALYAPAFVAAQFGPLSGTPPMMPRPNIATTPALTALLPGVDQELKLDTAQRQRITAIAETERTNLETAMRNSMMAGPPAAGMNRKAMTQSQRKIADVAGKKSTTALGKILRPEQVSRLAQLQRQREGAFVFERADVVEALKLTADQRRDVAAILDGSMPSAPHGKSPPREGVADRSGRPRKPPGVPAGVPDEPTKRPDGPPPGGVPKHDTSAARERITALFSDAQKVKWNELIGEKYSFGTDE